MKKGYGFLPDIEYIKDTMNLSPREKLIWLQEANEFVRRFVSKKKLKLWDKFRSGKI